MADLPTLAEITADIKQGNPDMSDAAARRAARQALDDMMDQAQEKFDKRKAEGKEGFMCGGSTSKKKGGKTGYKAGASVKARGEGCCKRTKKCKMY